MAEVNPKAYPLADAQLTITILDIVQQAAVRTIRASFFSRVFVVHDGMLYVHSVVNIGKRVNEANDWTSSSSLPRIRRKHAHPEPPQYLPHDT